MYKRFC